MVRSTAYRWLRGVAIALLAASAASACAARQSPQLSETFLKGHEPGMSLGESPELSPELSDDLYTRGAITGDQDVATADTPVVPLAGTVEDSDPYLMTALARAGSRPSPENHRRVAELYQSHGILDLASDHLEAAARLDPRDAATHDGIARLWRAWGLHGLGLGAAYRAVSYAPDSPQARNTLGTLLQAVGWWTHARQEYEAGLALDATASYVLNNLCYLSFIEGEFEAAIEACKAAIHSDPTLVEPHNNLALAYFAANQDELASEALESGGSRSTALYNRGIAHMARGDHIEAAASFTRASLEKPGWAAPRQRASQALSHSSTRPAGQ